MLRYVAKFFIPHTNRLNSACQGLLEGQAFPAHFWLISAQEQFVLLALIGMVLVGRSRIRVLLIAMIVIGVGSRIIGGLIWMPEHPALATETPFAVADALALGMLCRIAIREGTSKTRLWRGFLVAALATFVIWSALPNTYAIYFSLVPVMTALIGCLIILVLADEVRVRRFERAMLSWPAVVLLGQMSLSLFLLHPFVNTIINLAYARQTGEVIPWWLLAIVGPPVSILVAYVYFRTVEVPIRRLRAGSWGKRVRPGMDEAQAAQSRAAKPLIRQAGLQPVRS